MTQTCDPTFAPVVCADCLRTGRFIVTDEQDEAALHRDLTARPWRCVYHDTDYHWHSMPPTPWENAPDSPDAT